MNRMMLRLQWKMFLMKHLITKIQLRSLTFYRQIKKNAKIIYNQILLIKLIIATISL